MPYKADCVWLLCCQLTKYFLTIRILAKLHILPKPALYPTFLIIIRPGTFSRISLPALEPIDIKIPHIIPNLIKIFDQLIICHDFTSPHFYSRYLQFSEPPIPAHCRFLSRNIHILPLLHLYLHCIEGILLPGFLNPVS